MPPNRLSAVTPIAVAVFVAAASLLCSIPVHAGFACLSSPCVHGVCVDQLNSTYTCYCIDGYTGVHCQTNWDECWSSPCLNGGLCLDGVADYNCSCLDGYAGHDCELNIDECLSNPCQNNGTCMDFTNGFTCQCPAGYTGTHCEVDLAVCNSTGEILCKNGGECVEGPGVSFLCNCLPGWNGRTCEDEIDQCDSRPCKNGAVCINKQTTYSCACLFGYTGRDCDVTLRLCEEHECQNHALCLIEDRMSVCYCVPDYHGKYCQYQYDECQLGIRCENGGTCVDGVDGYTCTCPTGWTGESCECGWGDDRAANCNTTVYKAISTEGSATTGRPQNADTTPWPGGNGIPVQFGTTFGTSDGAPFATDFSIYVTAAATASLDYSTHADHAAADSTTMQVTEPASGRYTATAVETGETTRSEWTDTRWTYDSSTAAGTEPAATADDGAAGKTDEFHDYTTTPTVRQYGGTDHVGTTSTTRRSAIWTTSLDDGGVNPRTERTRPTTATIPTSKSTINYRQPTTVADERDVAFTTFYDEMSTDFDYNITGFTDQRVTDRVPSVADKSCENILCLNGGRCEKSKSAHKCTCSFGWTGETCAEKLAIKVSAFTGRSFLSHRLSNRTGAEISMEIRTLAPNGILFYAQVTTHMYMCLYLQDGLLKFQFSCGIQTMLFSETRYRVNTGHRLLLTAALEHGISYSMSDHCKASLRVNETLAMSGEQATDTSSSEKAKKVALLYLGGLPPGQNATVELPVTVGITGCISRLQIDEVVHNVYENATDGYGVIECASLTCLSSPCQSYATCVEFGDSWNCLCPSGFVGKNCERSVCENNPCKFGATCVIYPGSGFICLCPLGKHGMYCDHDLEIGEPFFPGSVSGLSSFAAYSIPAEIHQSFELSMHFAPNFMDQISLMMYIGHDASTDHVALSFIKGYIVLTWNLGAGARRIFTPKPINFQPKKTHVVKLGRDGKTAWLAVDNFQNVTGQSVGRLSQLNTKPILYLGGHESPGMADLPHDLPLHTGFVGCISSVKLMTGHVTIPLSLSRAYSNANTGRSVSQCSTNECYRNNICQHSGACIQHGSSLACVCDDGWFGPVCSHRYNACDGTRHNCSGGSTCVPVGDGYECDCPAGRSGKHCDRDERLSDVRFLGKRSYLSVSTSELNVQQFSIELEIKPSDEHGIVFFVKHDATRKMFLCLSLYGSVLELRISVQVGEMRRQDDILVVRSGRVLTLSEWHSVRVGRYRRKLYLWVDGMVNYAVIQSSESISDFENLIYFGGLPDLSSMPPGSTTGLPVPFTGCIRRLSIDYDTIPLNYSSIAAGRNIADCDGTPCGGDLCHHGGSCWLDMDMKPHCHCVQEFTGESCSKQVPCTEFKCQNKGRCVSENGNTSFVCKCSPGWDGPFCTKELPTGPPLFKGHGYLVLSKLSSLNKREGNDEVIIDNETQFISLNFSTVYDNGLLIWTSQEEWYLGLGIINGLLTVTWAQKYKRPNKLISPLSNITNGEWHTARLNVTKLDITLELDAWISDIHQHNVESFNLNDNVIYLGGVPEEKYFLNDRQELFKGNFRGCIEQLTVQENVITDFKHYDSVNVDVCDIW